MQTVREITHKNPQQPNCFGNPAKTPLTNIQTTQKSQKTQKVQMTNEKSSTSTQCAPHIDRLFARFSAVYGHVWQSQFKPAAFLALAKEEWSKTLSSIEEKNMDLAIDEIKKRV